MLSNIINIQNVTSALTYYNLITKGHFCSTNLGLTLLTEIPNALFVVLSSVILLNWSGGWISFSSSWKCPLWWVSTVQVWGPMLLLDPLQLPCVTTGKHYRGAVKEQLYAGGTFIKILIKNHLKVTLWPKRHVFMLRWTIVTLLLVTAPPPLSQLRYFSQILEWASVNTKEQR